MESKDWKGFGYFSLDFSPGMPDRCPSGFGTSKIWTPQQTSMKTLSLTFERSKGDLGQFLESCKRPFTRAQLSKHMDLRCFLDVGRWKLEIYPRV